MSDSNAAASAAPVNSAEPTELETAELGQEEQQSSEAPVVASKAEPAPAASSKKKFKGKVDGEEFEEELDLANEAEIIKRLQLARVSQKRMQESSGYKKELSEIQSSLTEFFEELQKNPLTILNNPDLQINKKMIIDALMAEEMEKASKSPEQLKLEEAEKKVREYEEREASEKQKKEAAEKDRLREEAGKQLESDIAEAIEAKSLPKSKVLSEKIMSMARFAYTNGIDIDVKDLVPIAAESYKNEIKNYLGEVPDELLEQLVSQDRIKNVRNKYLQSLKKQNVSSVKSTDVGQVYKKKEEPKKVNSSDFWKKMGI